MELTEREKDLMQALSGTTKAALSLVPGLGQAIAGYDAYKKSQFDRSILKIIEYLQNKIENLQSFFENDWIKTEEGQQFARKVFDSACDTQLEDKQELFVNALINGINDQKTSILEKLKFIDMLRNLSRASLMVLAEMHKMFKSHVRGPGRDPDPVSSFPHVDPGRIAESLSKSFHPYLVTASISEMESQGLFSRTGEWSCPASPNRWESVRRRMKSDNVTQWVITEGESPTRAKVSHQLSSEIRRQTR